MPHDDRPTVYSTDSEFKICPRCKQSPCRCPKAQRKSTSVKSLPPNQQKAILQVEKKGRGGKTVTIVRGLVLSPDDLKALAKTLKEACGTGGTIKEDTIEIQGDQRARLSAKLKSLGYKTNV